MNFFPATLTDVGVRLPFGDVTLTAGRARHAGAHPKPGQRDRRRPARDISRTPALIDTYARIKALTFQVTVDLVESLGADKYLHFRTEGEGAQAAQLAELAAESGVG